MDCHHCHSPAAVGVKTEAGVGAGRPRQRHTLTIPRAQVKSMSIPIHKLKKRWMKDPGFKGGYDALAEEFSMASVQTEARTRANLSQQQLAEREGTLFLKNSRGHGQAELRCSL